MRIKPFLYASLLASAASFQPLQLWAQDAADSANEGSSAKEDQIQKLLRESAEKRAKDREQRQLAADHHYSTAKNLYDRSLEDGVEDKPRLRDLREAKSQLETALGYMADHAEARKLLTIVNSSLGVPDDKYEDYTQRFTDERQAYYEQQIAEIQNRYDHAVKLFNDKNFDNAIKEFEGILDAIEFLPYNYDFTALRTQIVGHIKKAESQRMEAQKELAQMRRTQAEELAREDLVNQRELHYKRISQLFERAKIRYEGHEYDKASKLLKEVLLLDPDNRDAKVMLEQSEFNLDKAGNERVSRNKVKGIVDSQLYADEVYTIYDPSTFMHYPDNYQEVALQRKTELFSGSIEEEANWKTDLKARLKSPAKDPYDSQPVGQILSALESVYEVTIIVNEEVVDKNAVIDLPARNMTFEQALNILVNKIGADKNLGWTLRDGAIIIDDKSKFTEESHHLYYDVRDLIGELRDFKGPEISLAGGEEGGGITIEEADNEGDEPITGDGLKELIKTTVEPESWDSKGHSIEIRNGSIVVLHEPKVHEQIQELLSHMRKQRALQVSVQTRFLRVMDNDITHMGIDWTGLNAVDNLATSTPGDFVVLDNGGSGDTTALTNMSVPGYVGPMQSNAFLRGRLLQNLGRGYRILDQGSASMLSTGGLLNWTFLNDFQVSAIIKAMTLQQKGTVLVAPMVTCFNTQRANLSVLQQQAYIRDLTAVVNVQIGLFDPDIGYIQSGTTLDVRPIVSHDRKYITLELKPTVAELVDLRSIPVPSTASGSASIEAPEMTLRAIRTTVSVPDGGTLLMGGYAVGQEIDDYTGIPFLSKIPILNFLTGASLRNREHTTHYMMVKAVIVDQAEIEKDLFGTIE
ncbi:MAG: hypothetical protein AB7F75_05000 [Planctomycetota bacterium]